METLQVRDMAAKSENSEAVKTKKAKPMWQDIENKKFDDWLEKMEAGDCFDLSV